MKTTYKKGKLTIPIEVGDTILVGRFKNKAVKLLRNKPNNAPNLRKLKQMVNTGIREWDDISYEALDKMGYRY